MLYDQEFMGYDIIETDLLIIGSGAAGLMAAVQGGKMGLDVLVIDKGIVGKCGSTVSAVQTAVTGKWSSSGDSLEAFYQDILESGKGLSNPRLVHTFVSRLEQILDKLVEWGLRFDRNAQGKLEHSFTSGHTYNRSLNAGKGRTGSAILQVLVRQANQLSNIRKLNFIVSLNIQIRHGQVCGVLAYDLVHNRFLFIRCKALILACGGLGQLYQMTTNPVQSTGDGYALALKAKIKLIDMEQIQFYPACLIKPKNLSGFCLSFYHYSKMYNLKNERFMERYDPVHLEDVPRDVMCYALSTEIAHGRCTCDGGIILDVRDQAERVRREFPHEYDMLKRNGIDLSTEWIEIAPAAHFAMGGVLIDEAAMTSIQQLYAAGETAGGLHGGNRLGNNALPECLVFGSIAAESAAKQIQSINSFIDEDKKELMEQLHHYYSKLYGHSARKTYRPYQLKRKIKEIMTKFVFVLRDKNGLERAERELNNVTELYEKDVYVVGLPYKCLKDVQELFEVEHMILTARAIVASALARKETRGAHVRLDFPQTDNVGKNLLIQYVGGKFKINEERS